ALPIDVVDPHRFARHPCRQSGRRARNCESADRIELVADRREARMVNALGNVGQPRPFAARRIEAPQHLLGLPAWENTEPAEHIDLPASRRPVVLPLAVRDRLEGGPLALRKGRAGRQHTNQNGRRYRSAHWIPPPVCGRVPRLPRGPCRALSEPLSVINHGPNCNTRSRKSLSVRSSSGTRELDGGCGARAILPRPGLVTIVTSAVRGSEQCVCRAKWRS